MRYLLTTILMFGAWMVGMAANEITYGGFKFVIEDNKIAITADKSNASDLVIPSEIKYNNVDYPVTAINSLMADYTRDTENVYIPSSVKNLCSSQPLFKIQKNQKLRTIVFQSGDFEISSSNKLIMLGSILGQTVALDNIIVLSSCNITVSQILESDHSVLLKPNEITITYCNDRPKQRVQMYFYRKESSIAWSFGQSKLDDLLSALAKSGENLSTIQCIDLSGLNQPDISIAELSLPESCSQAQIFTESVTVEDLNNFDAPTSDNTGIFSYSRTNAKDWNSVCLPFPIKETDFPENTKIYTMTGGSETSISLNRIAEGTTLPAGTPCFIYSEADNWNLYIEATISSEVAPVTVSTDYWDLYGSFTKQLLGEGKYKLNGSGTAFVQTTSSSNVYPFRCYIQPKSTSGGAPARLSVDIDEEASITLVPNDAEPQTVKLYDLMGRPRQGNASGLFIRGKH